MATRIHELITGRLPDDANRPAITAKKHTLSYAECARGLTGFANGLLAGGIAAGDRVGVYLPKQPEAVLAMFGASAAGACFVPINSVLKARQVAYIVAHCDVRVLVTSAPRWAQLAAAMAACHSLEHVILVGDELPPQDETQAGSAVALHGWGTFTAAPAQRPHLRIDADIAAILYTSGSTGNPKGVVLSHRNMIAGAQSVASYLHNTPEDRILAVLPLSFDAGLSQLTTAFSVGASVVLMDYLLPNDVIRAVVAHRITGLAAVPPLWNQLVQLPWPAECASSLRYITNTGGAMPVATTRALQERLPQTDIYLMYGLTEAFRSTFLPPQEVNTRPNSIGKAIPNAEILVVNDAGEICADDEPGELVHRGALVSLGYWNDPEETARRFRPAPGRPGGLPLAEFAVWSGDQVVRDAQGYLYFVSRKDDMIKTSGYRVSPTEVEEVAYGSGLVAGAVALGLPHAQLGQAILLLVTVGREAAAGATATNDDDDTAAERLRSAVLTHCRQELPGYMVPQEITVLEAFPHNQNGKIDRRALKEQFLDRFTGEPA